jgi:hypothetical protein
MALGLWGRVCDWTSVSLNFLNQKNLILRTQTAISQIRQFEFVLLEGQEKS